MKIWKVLIISTGSLFLGGVGLCLLVVGILTYQFTDILSLHEYNSFKKHNFSRYSTIPKPITPLELVVIDFEESHGREWSLDKKGRNESRGFMLDNIGDYTRLIRTIPVIDVEIAKIKLVGWIKTEKLDGVAYYYVESINNAIIRDGDKEIYGKLKEHSSLSLTGDTPWTEISSEIDIPLGTKEIEIYCRCVCKKGAAYFDDIEVKAIAIYENK